MVPGQGIEARTVPRVPVVSACVNCPKCGFWSVGLLGFESMGLVPPGPIYLVLQYIHTSLILDEVSGDASMIHQYA